MGNIVLLDELTINKIAAGEVIERPASVIKEMVENSIDAQANNINIEIKNGGISYIRITDNGKGIEPDDMEIAFERHATSKIRSADDLALVKSMGFRGEALASIAAVSKVEMISRTQDSQIGNKIVIGAGKIIEKEEIGSQVGTSITVNELFFNTPVRYKFLKKDFTESGYIEDIITRLALIHPNIAFKLVNNGKDVLQTNGDGNIKNVIYNIFGMQTAQEILEIEYTYEDVKITGVVGKPDIARSSRTNQIFFVNKRYIKDKTISGAVEKSFKGMLPIGKYGFVILNIELDSSKVDINVHPTKLEVRFEEEPKIFKAVYHSIKETLLNNNLIIDTEKGYDELKEIDEIQAVEEKQKEESIKNNPFSRLFRDMNNQTNEVSNNIVEDLYKDRNNNVDNNISKLIELQKNIESVIKKDNQKELEFEKNSIEKDDENPSIQYELEEDKIETKINNTENLNNIESNDENSSIEYKLKENEIETKINNTGNLSDFEVNEKKDYEIEKDKFENMYVKIFGKLPNSNNIEKTDTKDNISVFEEIKEYKTKYNYKFIGIAFSTYIIIEVDSELYLIDQHAAHERILYEKVKENFYNNDNKDSQMMLLPDIITLTHKEMEIAKDNLDVFEKAGFIIEEFGDNTMKISGTPSICTELDTKELFLETLDEINTVARTAKQEIEEKFISTIACKAAVKANMKLSKEEVENLLETLLQLPNPFTCPHGRPTAIKMSKYDLEKKFARS